MTNDHLVKIFEGCISLQEIQLLWCHFSDETPIKPPSQVKRLEMKHNDISKLDVSDCTQLEDL